MWGECNLKLVVKLGAMKNSKNTIAVKNTIACIYLYRNSFTIPCFTTFLVNNAFHMFHRVQSNLYMNKSLTYRAIDVIFYTKFQDPKETDVPISFFFFLFFTTKIVPI